MSSFSSVHSPLISWSRFQIWQLSVGLLILVLYCRGTITSSFWNSLSNELYCSFGSGPELSPLEEPLDSPNPNTFRGCARCTVCVTLSCNGANSWANIFQVMWHFVDQNCIWIADISYTPHLISWSKLIGSLPTHGLLFCTACALSDVITEELNQFLSTWLDRNGSS